MLLVEQIPFKSQVATCVLALLLHGTTKKINATHKEKVDSAMSYALHSNVPEREAKAKTFQQWEQKQIELLIFARGGLLVPNALPFYRPFMIASCTLMRT
jgi:hypothetical protein